MSLGYAPVTFALIYGDPHEFVTSYVILAVVMLAVHSSSAVYPNGICNVL